MGKKSKVIQVTMGEEQTKAVTEYAQQNGLSVASVIRMALSQYLHGK